MSRILIEARALAFASFAVNPDSNRYHLRGVRIEHHAGHAVCIATDGLMLLFARSSFQTDPFEPFTLNFRKSGRLFVCARKMGPMVSITIGPDGEAVWAIERMNGTVIERGFVELLDAEDQFPEWRALLPRSPVPVSPMPIDVWHKPIRWLCRAVDNYQGDVACTLRLASPGPGQPIVAVLPATPGVGGLIVPVSCEQGMEIVFPDWTMLEPQNGEAAKDPVVEDAA
ncbi:hypothetical protein [Gluconobacter kondonii]|uniref:Uncharacterized protein n=1 Tax=Gluconobacter kondonii TaxID=941463 RepID=A0ABQ5WVX7_9PROT|nr:hypothetical protein [Gluconobacter kondonii]GBR34983.1 hypothetical protein AA3266_1999 [Gluconobacter kondonii NBRC 3266]GLQ67187.1 hypothetical protein GCM10007870_27720 [Gluconobacter kondonii]